MGVGLERGGIGSGGRERGGRLRVSKVGGRAGRPGLERDTERLSERPLCGRRRGRKHAQGFSLLWLSIHRELFRSAHARLSIYQASAWSAWSASSSSSSASLVLLLPPPPSSSPPCSPPSPLAGWLDLENAESQNQEPIP